MMIMVVVVNYSSTVKGATQLRLLVEIRRAVTAIHALIDGQGGRATHEQPRNSPGKYER
jgi:hypothetical protein